jgi:hypothetical protein
MVHQLPLSYSGSVELPPTWCSNQRRKLDASAIRKRQLMKRRCRTPYRLHPIPAMRLATRAAASLGAMRSDSFPR